MTKKQTSRIVRSKYGGSVKRRKGRTKPENKKNEMSVEDMLWCEYNLLSNYIMGKGLYSDFIEYRKKNASIFRELVIKHRRIVEKELGDEVK